MGYQFFSNGNVKLPLVVSILSAVLTPMTRPLAAGPLVPQPPLSAPRILYLQILSSVFHLPLLKQTWVTFFFSLSQVRVEL